MALNWTMLSPERSPVPLPHELIIRTIDSPGADLTLLIPNSLGSSSGSIPVPGLPSSSSPASNEKKIMASGGLWLTDTRLIFVSAAPSKDGIFESLSIPLTAILSTKFEQPFFGANYLVVDIKPTPSGGLTDGTQAEIRLKDKGIFEFVSSLEKTRERAVYMRRQSADEEEGLPSYSTPAGPSLSSTPVPPASSETPLEAPPAYEA